LKTWKAKTEALAVPDQDGDVKMDSNEEQQLGLLKDTVADFRERFKGNAWVMAVLDNL
jgi:hypothetical protein